MCTNFIFYGYKGVTQRPRTILVGRFYPQIGRCPKELNHFPNFTYFTYLRILHICVFYVFYPWRSSTLVGYSVCMWTRLRWRGRQSSNFARFRALLTCELVLCWSWIILISVLIFVQLMHFQRLVTYLRCLNDIIITFFSFSPFVNSH